MTNRIVMRTLELAEKRCDRSGKCAGGGKQNPNATGGGLGQEFQNKSRDGARFFGRFAPEKKMNWPGRSIGKELELIFLIGRGGNSLARRYAWHASRRLNWQSSGKGLFPGSDPTFIEIASFIARISQNGCSLFCGVCRGPQPRPTQ